MNLLSVNVAVSESINVGGRKRKTGIFKQPRDGRAQVNFLGLEGDLICNRKHHGGPDQAVYAYSDEDYQFWSNDLGMSLAPGTFGENFTTSGVDLNSLCIGDIFEIGEIKLQVTAPRIPCSTLSAIMKQKDFARKFKTVNRSGAYFRVLSEGYVIKGEAIHLLKYEGDRVSLPTFFSDLGRDLSENEIKRYLRLPIDSRSRDKFENKLDNILLVKK